MTESKLYNIIQSCMKYTFPDQLGVLAFGKWLASVTNILSKDPTVISLYLPFCGCQIFGTFTRSWKNRKHETQVALFCLQPNARTKQFSGKEEMKTAAGTKC